MLPDWELDALRSEIDKLLPDTCQILARTAVADGMGEQSETWTVAAEAPCRLDAEVKGEGIAGAGLQPYERYSLTLPFETELTGANRVKIGDTTYNVIGVNLSPSWP